MYTYFLSQKKNLQNTYRKLNTGGKRLAKSAKQQILDPPNQRQPPNMCARRHRSVCINFRDTCLNLKREVRKAGASGSWRCQVPGRSGDDTGVYLQLAELHVCFMGFFSCAVFHTRNRLKNLRGARWLEKGKRCLHFQKLWVDISSVTP